MAKSDEELYVPLLTGAQRLFGTKNVDSINVGVEKDANVDEIMMSIERILRAQHDIGPGQIMILILMITVSFQTLEDKQQESLLL